MLRLSHIHFLQKVKTMADEKEFSGTMLHKLNLSKLSILRLTISCKSWCLSASSWGALALSPPLRFCCSILKGNQPAWCLNQHNVGPGLKVLSLKMCRDTDVALCTTLTESECGHKHTFSLIKIKKQMRNEEKKKEIKVLMLINLFNIYFQRSVLTYR